MQCRVVFSRGKGRRTRICPGSAAAAVEASAAGASDAAPFSVASESDASPFSGAGKSVSSDAAEPATSDGASRSSPPSASAVVAVSVAGASLLLLFLFAYVSKINGWGPAAISEENGGRRRLQARRELLRIFKALLFFLQCLQRRCWRRQGIPYRRVDNSEDEPLIQL